MIPGRERITDLIDADPSSARYCGYSIGRVMQIERDGAVSWLLVRRIERSGDRVYGVGEFVGADKAVRLQTQWDVRWGLQHAPNPPAKPDRPPSARPVKADWSDVDGAAAAIVAAGYRELARRCHPDVGGSHATMSLLTQAKRQLSQILDLARLTR